MVFDNTNDSVEFYLSNNSLINQEAISKGWINNEGIISSNKPRLDQLVSGKVSIKLSKKERNRLKSDPKIKNSKMAKEFNEMLDQEYITLSEQKYIKKYDDKCYTFHGIKVNIYEGDQIKVEQEVENEKTDNDEIDTEGSESTDLEIDESYIDQELAKRENLNDKVEFLEKYLDEQKNSAEQVEISKAQEQLKDLKNEILVSYTQSLDNITYLEIDQIPDNVYASKKDSDVKKLHDLLGKMGIQIGDYKFGPDSQGYGKYGSKTQEAVNVLERYLRVNNLYDGLLDDGNFGKKCKAGLKAMKQKSERDQQVKRENEKFQEKQDRYEAQKFERLQREEALYEQASQPVKIPKELFDFPKEKLWATMKQIPEFQKLAAEFDGNLGEFVNNIFGKEDKSFFQYLGDLFKGTSDYVEVKIEDLQEKFNLKEDLSQEQKEDLNRRLFYPLMISLHKLVEIEDAMTEDEIDGLNDKMNENDIEFIENERAALQNKEVDVYKDNIGWWNDGIPLRGVRVLTESEMIGFGEIFPDSNNVFAVEAYGFDKEETGRRTVYFNENGLNVIIDGNQSLGDAAIKIPSKGYAKLDETKQLMKFGEQLLALEVQDCDDLLLLEESGTMERQIAIEKSIIDGIDLSRLNDLYIDNQQIDLAEDVLADILILMINNVSIDKLSTILKTTSDGKLYISGEGKFIDEINNILYISIEQLYENNIRNKAQDYANVNNDREMNNVNVTKKDFYKIAELRNFVLDNMSHSELFDNQEQMLIMARKVSDLDNSGNIDTIYEMRDQSFLGIKYGEKKTAMTREEYEMNGWQTDRFSISETLIENALTDLIKDKGITNIQEFKVLLTNIRKLGANLVLLCENFEEVMKKLNCTQAEAKKISSYLQNRFDEEQGEVTDSDAMKAGMYVLQTLAYTNNRDLYSELYQSSSNERGLDVQENSEMPESVETFINAFEEARALGILDSSEMDDANPWTFSFGAKYSEYYSGEASSVETSYGSRNFQNIGGEEIYVNGDRQPFTQELMNQAIADNPDSTIIRIEGTDHSFTDDNQLQDYLTQRQEMIDNAFEDSVAQALLDVQMPGAEFGQTDWVSITQEQIVDSVLNNLSAQGIDPEISVNVALSDSLSGTSINTSQETIDGILQNCTISTEQHSQGATINIQLQNGETIKYVISKEGVVCIRQRMRKTRCVETRVKCWKKIGKKLTLQLAAMRDFAKGELAGGSTDRRIYGGAVLEHDVALNDNAQSDTRLYLKAGAGAKVKLVDGLNLKSGITTVYEVEGDWKNQGSMSLEGNLGRLMLEAGIETDLVGDHLFNTDKNLNFAKIGWKFEDINVFLKGSVRGDSFWSVELGGSRNEDNIKKQLREVLNDFSERFENMEDFQKQELIVLIFGEQSRDKMSKIEIDKFFEMLKPIIINNQVKDAFVGDLMGAGLRIGEIGPADFISLFVEFAINAELVKKMYPEASDKHDKLNSDLLGLNIEQLRKVRATRLVEIEELMSAEQGVYSVENLINNSVGSIGESAQATQVEVYVDPRLENWVKFNQDGTFSFENPAGGTIPENIKNLLVPTVVDRHQLTGKDIKIFFGDPYIAEYASNTSYILHGEYISGSDMTFVDKNTEIFGLRSKDRTRLEEGLDLTRQNVKENRRLIHEMKSYLSEIWNKDGGIQILEEIEQKWSTNGVLDRDKLFGELEDKDIKDFSLENETEGLPAKAKQVLIDIYAKGDIYGLSKLAVKTIIIEQIMMRSNKAWDELMTNPEKEQNGKNYQQWIDHKKEYACSDPDRWTNEINTFKAMFSEGFEGYDASIFESFDSPAEALVSSNEGETMSVNNAFIGFMYTNTGAIMTTMTNTRLVHARTFPIADGIKINTGYFETCRNPAFFVTIDGEQLNFDDSIKIMADGALEKGKIGVMIRKLRLNIGAAIVPGYSRTQTYLCTETKDFTEYGTRSGTVEEPGEAKILNSFVGNYAMCRMYELTDKECEKAEDKEGGDKEGSSKEGCGKDGGKESGAKEAGEKESYGSDQSTGITDEPPIGPNTPPPAWDDF